MSLEAQTATDLKNLVYRMDVWEVCSSSIIIIEKKVTASDGNQEDSMSFLFHPMHIQHKPIHTSLEVSNDEFFIKNHTVP